MSFVKPLLYKLLSLSRQLFHSYGFATSTLQVASGYNYWLITAVKIDRGITILHNKVPLLIVSLALVVQFDALGHGNFWSRVRFSSLNEIVFWKTFLRKKFEISPISSRLLHLFSLLVSSSGTNSTKNTTCSLQPLQLVNLPAFDSFCEWGSHPQLFKKTCL